MESAEPDAMDMMEHYASGGTGKLYFQQAIRLTRLKSQCSKTGPGSHR